MTGEIRIIGGKYKGRKIKVCDISDLRPTPNRLRETIFNILQFDIKGAKCLDAFAGTGALGLEALSRGAEKVTFIESHQKAFLQLNENIQQFQTPNFILLKTDCLTFLRQTPEQFDIIFLDPPFKKDCWQHCVQIIYEQNILFSEGILYLESPEEIELDPEKWVLIKKNKLGEVYYAIFKILAKS
jgi:16S rRNA (guanine966-N2)-methyltransferase